MDLLSRTTNKTAVHIPTINTKRLEGSGKKKLLMPTSYSGHAIRSLVVCRKSRMRFCKISTRAPNGSVESWNLKELTLIDNRMFIKNNFCWPWRQPAGLQRIERCVNIGSPRKVHKLISCLSVVSIMSKVECIVLRSSQSHN